MPVLPPADVEEEYDLGRRRRVARGSTIVACVVLALVAVNNMVRGGFHVVATDGGVGRLPDLHLGTEAPTIIALFTLIGVNQAILGMIQASILIWRRDLWQPILGLQLALTAGSVLNLHFGRPLPVPVPGELFNQVLLPVVATAWLLGLIAGRRQEHGVNVSRSTRT